MGMQTLPLRSGHLDIKDAQCAKKIMGVNLMSHHIAFGAVGVQKERLKKIQFFSKVAKFTG